MAPTRHAPHASGSKYAEHHHHWMGRALDLAHSARGQVWPNPAVGCVIVRNDSIVGEGCTQPGGRPHAERIALDAAGPDARGATLYVTLEPCCHWGQTPPCVDAIIRAGIAAVHAARRDPDPRVDGRGFDRLRSAGLDVQVGLGAGMATDLMDGFFHRIATGHPRIEIARPGQSNTPIPQGFDAVLHSDGRCIAVIARTANGPCTIEQLDTSGGAHAWLDTLGGLGLTRVHVAPDDPIADRLRIDLAQECTNPVA
ncbi:bifunctional diaminohydroxyphosphoribosylaminopyrimidine deaminase/5-amino-6-(5-phosphoribosylamino)uracil reductase RibD [uncultured Salinisphaera sp.]|uniref:bifunctional diaminohydroxyphosphoribosylaminopyrimidine deaminase/5-amino-6-(5-phosphoribosylamino)uracil reductase RibD n=1 Tax=uncultured Salinisphaera sp. TaxID=359372 RepID=UPI0032B1F2B2